MAVNSTRRRWEEITGRLRLVRDGYHSCLSDVPPEVSARGSEWSISDLLGHVNADYDRNTVTRLLEEDNPQLRGGGGFDVTRFWERTVERTLANIDSALRIAEGLTDEQLNRAGQRGGREYTVLDALENWAKHLEEHLSQLRDEIRPREGLPVRE
ncbi:MAG: hypothetical protein EXR55_04685 [Dehalococcoidia bacterium]|nr:hypothetical protein [Dehalococcoidia bacterium]